MKIRQLITEAPKIGRKYQHIEDLVLTNGFHGAMHAIERLRDMSSNGGSIELKWDGMPVVYWGRDEKGVFHMIPKNAWAYLKRGQTQTASGASTVMNSPRDVKDFVLGTGGGADEGRQAFANQFASLWPYFEKISPKKGFIEGGVLFHPGTKPDGSTAMPTFNKATGTYDFTPNITTFHVPADSDIGKRIKSAKLMVAATGYYPSMGSDDEQRFPDAEQLSQPGIIVQGTTYVQEPVKVDEQGLANLEQFLKVHKDAIEKYLAPKKGLSNPGSELYNYLNQHLRTQGLVRDFPAWAKSKLSPAKALAMTSDGPGLQATLGAVEALGNEKMKLIGMLSQGLHGGLKQTKPEGYAQAHPNTKFKYDIPGQFVKAIDQMNWAPKKIDESIQRTGKSDTCVIGWGRGMGHSGHMLLASAVLTQAKEMGADPYFIVSKTVGKDDPLFPEEKLAIYRKVFPQFKNVFQVATDDMSTLNKVLENLSQQGYRRAVIVVGEDQVQAFQFLVRPAKNGEMVFKSLGFDDMRVISRQQTNDPGKATPGPRATPMREILMDPAATEQDKFAVWRAAMSPQISDPEVLDLMRKAESRMKTKKIKECLSRMRPLLKEGTTEQKIKMLKKLKEMVSTEGKEEALQYATQAHAGQTRAGGAPYISHPISVADSIRQYKKSHNLDALISAALLHDTVEDTDTTHEALHDLFGGLVASLVQELTSDKEKIQQMGKADYLAQKMAAMSSYALVIKLADRLDNVQDIATAKTPEWRAKYRAETEKILDYIEKHRALSGTHQKLIELIRNKLGEIDGQQGVMESEIEDPQLSKPLKPFSQVKQIPLNALL